MISQKQREYEQYIENTLIKKFIDPRIMEALESDLNTPKAMAILHEIRKEIEKMIKHPNPNKDELWRLRMKLSASMKFMGFGEKLPPMAFCG